MRKMELMKKVGILVILSIFTLTGTLFAQEKQVKKNYGAIKVGYLMPTGGDDLYGDFDNTFNFGASYGRFISNRFSMEIGIEKYTLDISNTASQFFAGDRVNGSRALSGELSILAFPVTGKFHIPIQDNIDGYVGGGFGWYSVDADISETWSAPGYLDNVRPKISDSGSSFGFHALAGADYSFNPNMSIGAEVKWSHVNQGIKDQLTGEEKDVNIGGLNFSMVAKLKF